jgi:hypothetical protein
MKIVYGLAVLGCIAFVQVGYAATAPACVYEYEMEIWRADALLKGNPMDHTSTRTRIYKNCGGSRTLLDVVDKCNHGTCPGGNAWPTDAPPDYHPVFKKKYEPIAGSPPKTGASTSGSVILVLANTIGKAGSRENLAITKGPIYPLGCDSFGYKALTKPEQIHSYGITGARHVCNNDTFMQLGQVVTGKMPDKTTVKRICENQNYNNYTGRDPKYMPTFKNVDDFVKKWGWDVSVKGHSAPPIAKPPIKIYPR